ncbi:MAG: ABC transporter substrate-binding protein [Anaerolineae bacterium]|nr:MAG: ABC transporter substrate-binding protein [Anaerolineae bacterium]
MYRNRLMALLGLLVIASMVLAACAPTPDVTEEPVDTSTPVDTATTEPTAPDPTAEPEVPATTRHGGWLDQVTMTVVTADAAVTQIAAGAIDVYASNLSTPQDIEAADAAGLERSFQFGIYYELTFNPSGEFEGNTFPATGKLNPFASAKVREAMNWLVDRNYINQEVYGGNAVPKFFSFVSGFPEYARYVETIRGLESRYQYDVDRANAQITAEMEAMGATLVDGKWNFGGEPVDVIFLIRTDSDGTRVPIGDYVSNQLESIGFTVTRQYGTSSELSALWVAGNIDDGLWHIYTGAWGVGGITRNDAGDFQFFYSPNSAYAFTTLWQGYTLEEGDLALYDDLANSAFTTLEQRDEMVAQALESTFKYNYRVWLEDGRAFSPWQPNVSVAFDLAAGVDINPLWPHTLRFDDAEGGSLNWGTPDLFVDPANPVGGSNWTYDNQWQLATNDRGVMLNPHTGIGLPQRIERAEVTIAGELPVGKTYDWVDLSFAETIDVPADAWIDWNVETETFITVGEAYPDGLTAVVKSVSYYPENLYDVQWHDGSNLDVADFVMGMIMTFAPGMEGSPIYDESIAGSVEAFKAGFKGFRIVSESPLVVEFYTDAWQSDAELNVTTLWPAYGYGDAAWHVIAVSNYAEANGLLAYTADKAEASEVEWTNYIGGPSLEILKTSLDAVAAEGTIPFSATLGMYITPEEAAARYANLDAFYAQYGHFWVGTGPYILSQVFLVEKQAVLVNNPNYIDLSDKWAGFSAPKIATAEVDGAAIVTVGAEATFDVFVTFEGEAYPADEIASVKYIVYNAAGEIVEVGAAAPVADGQYSVTLSADTTTALGAGSNKLEIAVVAIPVSVPAFTTFEFVTE